MLTRRKTLAGANQNNCWMDVQFLNDGQFATHRTKDENGRSQLGQPEIPRVLFLSCYAYSARLLAVCVFLRFLGLGVFALEVGEGHVQACVRWRLIMEFRQIDRS